MQETEQNATNKRNGRIIMNWVLRENRCKNVEHFQLAQDRVQWWALVKIVMNIWVLYEVGIYSDRMDRISFAQTLLRSVC